MGHGCKPSPKISALNSKNEANHLQLHVLNHACRSHALPYIFESYFHSSI